MKALVAHNHYRQPGGEDSVFFGEACLLEARGHAVRRFVLHNQQIEGMNRIKLVQKTIWNASANRSIREVIRNFRPDIAHFHNTFPLISPAGYEACRAEGIPVLQTLHNYRLMCPAATLFREGHACEECVEHNLLRGVRHACYRDSIIATSTVAAMLAFHRARRTWQHEVDCYIALTEFSRRKFIEAGLPADRVIVKPNFVHPDPGWRTEAGKGALYVGRLSPEKGLNTLLKAWSNLAIPIPLSVVGDGPLRTRLEARAKQIGHPVITFAGSLQRENVYAEMKLSQFLVLPSECYENFPMTILESFACGVPVIASRFGAMEEIVSDGRTGLHFIPGDPNDLAAKVEWAWSHPHEMAAMGREARAEYESKYTADRNYEQLLAIYEKAINTRGRTAPHPRIGNLKSSGNQSDQSRKLHLGCFDQVHDGWLNVDITPHLFVARVPGLALLLHKASLLSQQRYEQHRQGIFRRVRYLNAARPFPLPAERFDFVYCSHMLEHLKLADAVFCIREVHRVLRPGGIFRIAVPNLDELIQRYDSSKPDEFLSEFFEADQKLKKNRHHWHYNEVTLGRALRSAGFTAFERRSFQQGRCADLKLIETRRGSLFMEAVR